MSYYNLCGIESQHSNISKGKGGVHIKITGMQDSSQGRQKYKCDIEYMNKKKPRTNQFRQL